MKEGGFKRFKGGKPQPGGKPGGKPGRKPGRPKGGVFLHKKGGKKAEKRRQAEAAAKAAAAAAGGDAAGAAGAAAAVPKRPRAPVAAGGGGDDDDFGGMLDDMPDYAQPGSGASGSEGEGEGGEGSGARRPAKRRRKRGERLGALEFEAQRERARQIAYCSAEEQADWLWASYQQHTQASALERGGLTAAGIAPLPHEGSLEERLKALQPSSWQQEFCGGRGGVGGRGGGQHRGQQAPGGGGGPSRPPGSPSLLLVSPSAIGAVGLIKLVPQFNQACRVGKLFAKHFKVAEQEEALRTQVMCLAAGTPNRLCKLADGGALRLDQLRHVVLDVALDVKQRDILAIPETRADWHQLFERHLKQRLADGLTTISLINSDDLQQPRGGA